MVKIRKARKTRKRKMRGGAGSGGPRRIVDSSKELAALRQRLVALNDGQPVGFTEKGLADRKNRLRKLTGDRLTERDNILLKELQKKLRNTYGIQRDLRINADQRSKQDNLEKNLKLAREEAERKFFANKAAAAAGEEDYVMVPMGPRRTIGSKVAATAAKAKNKLATTATKVKNKVKNLFTRGGAKSRKRKRTRHKRRKSRKGVTRRKRR